MQCRGLRYTSKTCSVELRTFGNAKFCIPYFCIDPLFCCSWPTYYLVMTTLQITLLNPSSSKLCVVDSWPLFKHYQLKIIWIWTWFEKDYKFHLVLYWKCVFLYICIVLLSLIFNPFKKKFKCFKLCNIWRVNYYHMWLLSIVITSSYKFQGHLQCGGDKGALVLVENICSFHHLWGCDQESYGKFWERVTMARIHTIIIH